jgi:CAS/CSE protein, C-terminus
MDDYCMFVLFFPFIPFSPLLLLPPSISLPIPPLILTEYLHINRFTQADIHEHATSILVALFNKIESAGAVAEKVAENDYLMKCIMRVIITARQTLTPVFEAILGKLIAILGIMSRNPSNPNFAQYTFESVSALLR